MPKTRHYKIASSAQGWDQLTPEQKTQWANRTVDYDMPKQVREMGRIQQNIGGKMQTGGYVSSAGALLASFIPAVNKRTALRRGLRIGSLPAALVGMLGEQGKRVAKGYQHAADVSEGKAKAEDLMEGLDYSPSAYAAAAEGLRKHRGDTAKAWNTIKKYDPENKRLQKTSSRISDLADLLRQFGKKKSTKLSAEELEAIGIKTFKPKPLKLDEFKPEELKTDKLLEKKAFTLVEAILAGGVMGAAAGGTAPGAGDAGSAGVAGGVGGALGGIGGGLAGNALRVQLRKSKNKYLRAAGPWGIAAGMIAGSLGAGRLAMGAKRLTRDKRPDK